MSHVVVAMVLGLFAILLFVTRRPGRTWRLALPIGAVAVALTAVWSLPLIARNDMTQSMRYQKLVPGGGWRLWGWVRGGAPGAGGARDRRRRARPRHREDRGG